MVAEAIANETEREVYRPARLSHKVAKLEARTRVASVVAVDDYGKAVLRAQPDSACEQRGCSVPSYNNPERNSGKSRAISSIDLRGGET